MSARPRIVLAVVALAAIVLFAMWIASGDEEPRPEAAETGTDVEPSELPGAAARHPGASPGGTAPGSELADDVANGGDLPAAGGSIAPRPRLTGDAGVAVVLVPGPGGTADVTSGAKLGRVRYLLGLQRERLPQIEQAIADAERDGDTARAQRERERLALVRGRISQLEQSSTELETEAREDGTIGDAEQTGRSVSIGQRGPEASP